MDKEDVLHIYNEMLLSHSKEWNNSIAVTWLDLEFIVLSVVSQRKKNTVITYMMESKKNDTIELIYKMETDRQT